MRTVDLDELVRGTMTAAGICSLSIGPVRRQTWKVANIGIQCASPAAVVLPAAPTAKAYLGASTLGQYISGTYDGNNDNVPVGVTLTQGMRITVLWEGGDPASACLVTVNGTMDVVV